MNEFIVFWSFDNGKTIERIGYEKLDDNGNYVFKRINTDTKELRKDWHLGMITDNQGNANFYRFPYTGKTDINNKKIYADSSVVEFEVIEDCCCNILEIACECDYFKRVGHFNYYKDNLAYEIKCKNNIGYSTYTINGNRIKNIKIIDTLQENKLGLYNET